LNKRKSDIENERSPPELINPDEVIRHFSNPSTPGEPSNVTPPPYPFPTPHPYSSSTPAKPAGANGAARPGGIPFRPKHVHFGGIKCAAIHQRYIGMAYDTLDKDGNVKTLPVFTDMNVRTQRYTFGHPNGLLFATQFAQIALAKKAAMTCIPRV
jgi:hypothetical protein